MGIHKLSAFSRQLSANESFRWHPIAESAPKKLESSHAELIRFAQGKLREASLRFFAGSWMKSNCEDPSLRSG
jgi:hypothetical protein